MQITAENLRNRMASLTDDGLRYIVSASGDTYTQDARETARDELARRTAAAAGPSAPSIQPQLPPARRPSYAVEDAIAKPFLAVRGWFDALIESVLPEDTPPRIRKLFWVGATSTIPTLVFLVQEAQAFSQAASAGDPLAAVETIGRGGVPFWALLGVAGFLVAYGIRTRRAYPRYLGMVMVVGFAASTILIDLLADRLSGEMIVIGTGAYATIRYLLHDPEAIQYYQQLRGRPAAAPAESAAA